MQDIQHMQPTRGPTFIGKGVAGGQAQLDGPASRAGVRKLLVLITDGEESQGLDPAIPAWQLKVCCIQIHRFKFCLSMLPDVQPSPPAGKSHRDIRLWDGATS